MHMQGKHECMPSSVVEEEEECRSFFKVGVNEMPVQPTHDVISRGHVISGAGLLTPLGIDTIITM